MRQLWIDAVTNSYWFFTVHRDRIYSGSDVEIMRAASERGQTIFFSSLAGQQILVERVPDGRYAVVVTADPDGRIFDLSETDNAAWTRSRSGATARGRSFR